MLICVASKHEIIQLYNTKMHAECFIRDGLKEFKIRYKFIIKYSTSTEPIYHLSQYMYTYAVSRV